MSDLEKKILSVNQLASQNEMELAIAVLKDALDYVEAIAVKENDKNLDQVGIIKDVIETMEV